MFPTNFRRNWAVLASATTITLAAASAALAQGGGGGSSAAATPPPNNCVAQISAFANTPGYGPYSPYVASIKTKVTVKNCAAQAASWQARVTYAGPFFGGQSFAVPLTCSLLVPASSAATCSVVQRYLYIQQTYGVTLDIVDATGTVLATSTANVDTPSVPNPGPVA